MAILMVVIISIVSIFCCYYLQQQYKNKTQQLQTILQFTQLELTTLQSKLNETLEDPVTHVLGGQLFQDRLHYGIQESERYGLTMGLLFVKINEFTVVNQALGHELADKLIKEVAERLQQCIRQVDSITRFHQDTFVILLTQLAKAELAAVIAQRMLQALAQPFHIQEHALYVNASIGIAIYPTDGQQAASLLQSAEQALELAKEKGKHLYQFFQEKMHVQSQRELLLYTGLSLETVFEEFVLYYQPIIDTSLHINEQPIVCMQALLHWHHPEIGLITPEELFHHADKQRKLNMILEWQLRKACEQFLHWRSLGFRPALLAMPVAIKQLESSQFIYRLSHILQELNFDPQWLLMEIKEDFSPISFDVLEKSLNMLAYLGIKIAIVDFGRHMGSLRYLKHFTIQYVKLDSSFTENIEINAKTQAVVQSVIALARHLSIEVIADGIESQKQVEMLVALGCQLMQGHFLGKPLLGQEVTNEMVVSLPDLTDSV